MPITLKRVYDPPVPGDGTRVLVDRLWPRGLTKEKAAIDEWLRDLAPSNELRKWFHAERGHWAQFRTMYLKELSQPEAQSDLGKLYQLAHQKKRLTLLFASKNVTSNNATVLKELLEGMRKPPTGVGPSASGASKKRASARRR